MSPEYKTNPVMAHLYEKLQLKEMFKDELSNEEGYKSNSPDREPCTLLEDSVTKSLKEKTRDRSKSKNKSISINPEHNISHQEAINHSRGIVKDLNNLNTESGSNFNLPINTDRQSHL